MELFILDAVKVVFGIALLSYMVGTFRYFSSDGYSFINSIIQSFLHLFFCAYTLYGWIHLLLNTPQLELKVLTTIGGLWLFSCLLLFLILDYLRHSIPRKHVEETGNQ
jgi:hypothetical protein